MGWFNHQLDKLRENGNKRGGILTFVAHFLADSPSLAEPITFFMDKVKDCQRSCCGKRELSSNMAILGLHGRC